jgi:hypothetical protein
VIMVDDIVASLWRYMLIPNSGSSRREQLVRQPSSPRIHPLITNRQISIERNSLH